MKKSQNNRSMDPESDSGPSKHEQRS